jgi:hypothetical protein
MSDECWANQNDNGNDRNYTSKWKKLNLFLSQIIFHNSSMSDEDINMKISALNVECEILTDATKSMIF